MKRHHFIKSHAAGSGGASPLPCLVALLAVVAGAGAARGATLHPDSFLGYAAEAAAGIPQASLPAGPTLTPLSRLAPPAYADEFGAPAGATRPSPRAISNAIGTQAHRVEPARPLSTLSVAMLQLLTSHTHARTPTATDPAEAFDVPTADGDPMASTVAGALVLPLQRSVHAGGTGPGDPREQLNIVTPRLDGSAVYGSDGRRCRVLHRAGTVGLRAGLGRGQFAGRASRRQHMPDGRAFPPRYRLTEPGGHPAAAGAGPGVERAGRADA